MKYIFVIPSWSYRGGEKIFMRLAEAVAGLGNEVMVVAGRKEAEASRVAAKVEVVYPKMINRLMMNRWVYYFLGWVGIFYLLKKYGRGADWVITESNHCLYGTVLATVFSRTRIAWYVMAYESRHYKSNLLELIWNGSFGLWERFCVRRVDKFLALSENVKQIVEKRFGKKSEVLLPIIGFDNEGGVKKEVRMFYDKHKVLFMPGVFHGKKNQILAINVLQRLGGRFGLVLAGSGPDGRKLREKVAELGLTKDVYFAGVIAGENLNYCYREAFLTLVCSLSDNEGLSLTSLESLYFGTPVLVSAEAGVASLIKKKRLGMVSRARVDDFCRAIRDYEAKADKVKRMTKNGRIYVKTVLTAESAAKELMRQLKL